MQKNGTRILPESQLTTSFCFTSFAACLCGYNAQCGCFCGCRYCHCYSIHCPRHGGCRGGSCRVYYHSLKYPPIATRSPVDRREDLYPYAQSAKYLVQCSLSLIRKTDTCTTPYHPFSRANVLPRTYWTDNMPSLV